MEVRGKMSRTCVTGSELKPRVLTDNLRRRYIEDLSEKVRVPPVGWQGEVLASEPYMADRRLLSVD